ncbi:regulatory protein YcgZ [Pantoea sp. FN0302]|uniref:regulatory protein YcgZ n=2 Tax=Pantoea TaxID=53335 RepID=UPI003CF71C70
MMPQQRWTPEINKALAPRFEMADMDIPTQQETLGQIVADILRAGQSVNRKAICARLLTKLDGVSSKEMEMHYHGLLALVLGRE